MIRQLITHEFRASFRKGIWQKQIIVNLLIGLSLIYMAVNLLVLGVFLPKLLTEGFPGQEPFHLVNRVFVYYLLVDFLFRFFFQNLPVLPVVPYLHLPIRKRGLVHYILAKSFFSPFNFLPLFVLLPFAISASRGDYTAGEATAWFLSLASLILANNFLLLYVKRNLSGKIIVTLVLLSLIIGLVGAEIMSWISAGVLAGAVLDAVVDSPWLCLIILAWPILLYLLNYRFLRANLYPEEVKTGETTVAGKERLGFLNRYGVTGQLMAVELKLVWRHKRTRSALIVSLMFLLYPLIIFIDDKMHEVNFLFILVGIFTTGMFILNYGQYLISWEGNHFDSLMAQNIPLAAYFRAKLFMFIGVATVCLLASLPYILVDWHIVAANAAMYCFNIGFSTFHVMAFAMFGARKIDLSKSAMFNYQGAGVAQWLLALPIMIVPFIIYLPVSLIFNYEIALMVLAGISLVSLALAPLWLRILTRQLQKRKYAIGETFRQV